MRFRRLFLKKNRHWIHSYTMALTGNGLIIIIFDVTKDIIILGIASYKVLLQIMCKVQNTV